MSNINAAVHARERRFITIMFIDIVRSSDILRNLTDEAAEEIFDAVITRQIDICSALGGTINQVMGDGMMCLFGAEGPCEDHAFQAVTAAGKMQQDIILLRKKYENSNLAIRIGISSGEVLLKNAQSAHYRSRYQVVGEAVHIADRILKLAAPNATLISESTCKLAEKFFSFEKVSDLHWGGNRDIVGLYQKSSRRDFSSVMPQEPPIRGDVLDTILTTMRQSTHTDIHWVQGDAGFGKTFLAGQIARMAQDGLFDNIIRFNFYPQPFIAEFGIEHILLRAILPEDASALQRIVAQNPLLEKIGSGDFIYACLCDILKQEPLPHAAYASLDKTSKARVRSLVTAAMLQRFCDNNKVLLLFEDMHWAGEDDIRCLEIITRHEGLRLQLLFTSRQKPSLESTGDIHLYDLPAFSLPQSRQLLQSIGMDRKISARIFEKIHNVSAGNPYFIKEYGAWVRGRLDDGTAGKELIQAIDKHTPEEVANILYAKMAGLDRKTVEVAKTAAVQGICVDPFMLSSMCGMTPEECEGHLQDLQSADVLIFVEKPGKANWEFTHDLLQKVIYHSLPASTLLYFHGKALAYLKPQRNAEGYELKAHHARHANMPSRDYIYSKWAGKSAGKLSRYNTAIRHYTLSRRALDKVVSEGPSAGKHRVKLKFHEIECLFILSRYSAVRSRLDYILDRKNLLPGFGMLRKVLSFQGLYFWINGEIPKAAKSYGEILRKTDADIDSGSYLRESARFAHIHIDLGQYQKAVRHLKESLLLLEGKDLHAKYGMLTEMGPTLCSCLALAYAELGDEGKAVFYVAQAKDLLAESEDYFTNIYVCFFVANSLIVLSRHDEARPLLERALRYCSIVQSDLLKPCILSAYGLVLAKSGEIAAGLRHCMQALDVARKSDLQLRLSLFHIWHAEVLMMDGKYTTAMKHLRKAIKATVISGEKGRRAQAYYLMAECYKNLGIGTDSTGNKYKALYEKAFTFALEEKAEPLEQKIQAALAKSVA